jgi:hypothetical protein
MSRFINGRIQTWQRNGQHILYKRNNINFLLNVNIKILATYDKCFKFERIKKIRKKKKRDIPVV